MGERTFSRTELRAMARATAKSRAVKTGQSAHFQEWKHQASVKRILQSAATVGLAAEKPFSSNHRDASTLTAIAVEFPTLWDLLQARRSALLRINGVGPATLRKIQDYLESNDAKPAWGVK